MTTAWLAVRDVPHTPPRLVTAKHVASRPRLTRSSDRRRHSVHGRDLDRSAFSATIFVEAGTVSDASNHSFNWRALRRVMASWRSDIRGQPPRASAAASDTSPRVGGTGEHDRWARSDGGARANAPANPAAQASVNRPPAWPQPRSDRRHHPPTAPKSPRIRHQRRSIGHLLLAFLAKTILPFSYSNVPSYSCR